MFSQKSFEPWIRWWRYESDSLPVTFVPFHGFEVGIPNKWQKAISSEYGERALVYEMRELDGGIKGTRFEPCPFTMNNEGVILNITHVHDIMLEKNATSKDGRFFTRID